MINLNRPVDPSQPNLSSEELALIFRLREKKSRGRKGPKALLSSSEQQFILSICGLNDKVLGLSISDTNKEIAKYRNRPQRIDSQRAHKFGQVIYSKDKWISELKRCRFGIASIYHDENKKVLTSGFVTIEKSYNLIHYPYESEFEYSQCLKQAKLDVDSATASNRIEINNFYDLDELVPIATKVRDSHIYDLRELSKNNMLNVAFIMAYSYVKRGKFYCDQHKSMFATIIAKIGTHKISLTENQIEYEKQVKQMIEKLLICKKSGKSFMLKKTSAKHIGQLHAALLNFHKIFLKETKAFEMYAHTIEDIKGAVVDSKHKFIPKPNNHAIIKLDDLDKILDYAWDTSHTMFNRIILQLSVGLRIEETARLDKSFLLANNTLNYQHPNEFGHYLINKTADRVSRAHLVNPRVDLVAAIILRYFPFEISDSDRRSFWAVDGNMRKSLSKEFVDIYNEAMELEKKKKNAYERCLRTTTATMIYFSSESNICVKSTPRDVQNRLAHIDATMTHKIYAKNRPHDCDGVGVDKYLQIRKVHLNQSGKIFHLEEHEHAWGIYLLTKFLARYQTHPNLKSWIILELERIQKSTEYSPYILEI